MIAHDMLTYLSAGDAGLRNRLVPLRPYTYGELDHDQYNPSYVREYREGGSPAVLSDDPYMDEEEYYVSSIRYTAPECSPCSSDSVIPALDVLSLYSAEPDWGMDAGLHCSPLQVFTADSQGYRHLRYGFFLFRAGIVHKRALHFHTLASEAFNREDLYWGLRFSACALHYIEDLLSPYHLKPIPEWYWIPRIFRLRSVYRTIFNYHLNFELYTGYHLWRRNRLYVSCIEQAPSFPISRLKTDLLRASRKVRLLFYGLFGECEKAWAQELSSDCRRLSREWIEGYDPSPRLKHLICRWLELASGFVKGYIGRYVVPRMEELEP
jgi:hypothetical protein